MRPIILVAMTTISFERMLPTYASAAGTYRLATSAV
jgi:hypothetical protein